ncbi:MAG: DUF4159 domain-containing protein [Lentisphaerales bacterium]|nr:DUF4159 domain-containing protein [Lentisphaerales bacterium]
MKFLLLLFFLSLPLIGYSAEATQQSQAKQQEETLLEIDKSGAPAIRIGQVISVNPMTRSYPNALRSLLELLDSETTIKVDKDPRVFRNFEDDGIFECPFIYMNFVDRSNWEFSPKERRNLKRYLENGGFLYIDAGINSEFLRGNSRAGQSHSFADWSVTPVLAEAFKGVFSGKKFKPLSRAHKLYKVFYKGLPDPEVLPETVREFVVNEKWPQGTYSAVGLEVNDRIAVLCTPIIAMGWGKRFDGQWETNISFRIRESTKGLGDYLKNAAHYSSYQANREDGGKDTVFTDNANKPAWVKEPDNTWRVFRYVSSQTISNYAHEFYSRLGINIIVYSLTH